MTAQLRPHAARLNLVLETIKKNPKCWDQSTWHCGTSHCFMGWAQILSGKTANTDTVTDDASKWLRLTDYECSALAAGGNSLKRVKKLVELFSSDEYYKLYRNFKGFRFREIIASGIDDGDNDAYND